MVFSTVPLHSKWGNLEQDRIQKHNNHGELRKQIILSRNGAAHRASYIHHQVSSHSAEVTKLVMPHNSLAQHRVKSSPRASSVELFHRSSDCTYVTGFAPSMAILSRHRHCKQEFQSPVKNTTECYFSSACFSRIISQAIPSTDIINCVSNHSAVNVKKEQEN